MSTTRLGSHIGDNKSREDKIGGEGDSDRSKAGGDGSDNRKTEGDKLGDNAAGEGQPEQDSQKRNPQKCGCVVLGVWNMSWSER